MPSLSPLILAALLAAAPQEEPALDIWIGTLEVQHDVLQLRRCDLGQSRYALQALGADDPLAKLPLDAVKAGKPVTVTLVAAYEALAEDKHALRVSSVGEVTVGRSCHLLDFLKDDAEGA